MNIGFIGLGVMGAPMAGHLASAGNTIVTSLNKSSLPAALKDKNVTIVDTPTAVAEQCETVIIMVPDTPDVERVVIGPHGLIEGIGEMTEEHQKVLDALQEYYKKNGIAPMVRILSKTTGFPLQRIYELFPSGPGKGACKMAGLPKPTGCV